MSATNIKQPKALPSPNSDFYGLVETLPAEDLAVVKQVRAYMETKVQPIITKYWAEDAFPFELLPSFKELNIGGLGMEGYGCRGGSQLLVGLVAMEMSRVDSSIATFWGVHNGLSMGSIYLGGSEEQKQKWLPAMARMEKIGCFGLTEPLVGSGTAGGMTTTAKRDGDTWIQNKIALKVVQNGQITMKDCRVPEENRLQNDKSFRDTALVLRGTRYLVAWESTGCQMGAYEHALKYAQQRLQFGKPIGSFQLVQELLAKMLANVTASQCMVVRLAQLDAEGKMTDAHAALSKAFCTARMRETVAWARELLGGNGIQLDYNVARFFADAEALYSYEGTYQMQTLIVGKAVTGFSAFA